VSDPNNLPAVLAPSGVELELASLRQSLALIRLKLRSSAHSQGLGGNGIGIGFGSEFRSLGFMYRYYFHSCSRTYYLGQKAKTLKKAACSMVFGVRSRFRCAAPAGRDEGAANSALTSKTPESDSISTAVWPGRAAQRQADHGKRLSERSAT
jgi:hypothetical protein